ncbi:uncharacterized protein LOC108914297 [Anoplophora glabripennis]|uniref:uncharacterized protein LOC108914297 n=1 Tax=Anoplophora glabripennis TaxID=217634 RepID=UPI00087357A0|nr:uncharacterized protein LOC108914297 [Anoplophora glabripennis]
MSERKSEDYHSVDLTEDEDSSEENSELESPFHFVDCSTSLNDSTSTASELNPAISLTEVSSSTETSKQTILMKALSKFPKSESVQSALNKKVRQFSSIQIKPPSKAVQDTQNILDGDTLQQLETVSLDSDNESESVNQLSSTSTLLRKPHFHKRTTEITLPENDTIYSLKQPPGKVVIIKKNNKYYKIIIPHNVMPNISKSMGPVLINIPEVGPLVISNDPQSNKTKSSQCKTQQLSLNLDALDQNPDCESLIARKMKEQALRDKKFCWTFNSTRKRDLDGFTASDRLGFNKTEAKRARMCEKAINTVLSKFRVSLINKIDEYEKFNKALLRRDKIKLVKINSIIRANEETKKKRSKSNKCESDVPKKQETSNSLQSNFVDNFMKMDDYDSDLLVTKKVVILNSRNKEVELKRPTNEGSAKKMASVRRKSVKEVSKVLKDNNRKKYSHFKIKPCYVQISKDKRVEEAYIKYCKEKGLAVKRKQKPNDFPPKVDKHPGQMVNPTKHIALASHEYSKRNSLFEKKNMLLRKTIYTEEKLETEMNTLKPFLVMTEQTVTSNRNLEYYCNEFSKNNIIFVTNSINKFPFNILQDEGFISAVEIGYIKLVEASLFGKYATKGMTFQRTEIDGRRAEHNYSLTKK